LTDAELLGINIVFCNRKPKAECFKADVWIDDNPLMIPSSDSLLMMSLGNR